MIVSFNELQRKRFTKNEKVLESSSSEEIKHNDEQQGTQEVKVVEPNVERSVVEEVNVDTPDADDSKVGESNIYDEVITDGVKDPAEDKPVDHVVEKLLEELPDIKDRGSKLDVFVSPDGGTRLNV